MTGGHDGPKDVPALTGLRAVAAWWVVLYHVRAAFAPHVSDGALAFLAKGYLAVDMFFVLSGFVIYLNYANRIAQTVASVSDFMVRRVARIYPLHLLLLLLMGAYALARYQASGSLPNRYSPELFVLNLFLVHNWGFTDAVSWNIPSWSISTEFFAYMLFPLVALFVRWDRWPTWALPLAMLALATGLHLLFHGVGYTNLGKRIADLGLARCVVQFVIGTCLCALYLRLRRAPAPGAVAAVLIATAAGIAAGITALGWVETLAIPLLWIALVLGIALWPAEWPNPLAWRPLVYLGDISYSTYLIHYFAYILFKLVFIRDPAAIPLWAGPLFVLAILIASVALYHGFERPAQRWVLNRWKARSGAGVGARPTGAQKSIGG